MGKNAKIKAERRRRREAHRELVERWSTVPEGALTGRCPDPSCTIERCRDPFVTVSDLRGDPHDGPLVVVTYTTVAEGTKMRLNGGVLEFCVPGPADPLEDHARWTDAVIERFGPVGMDAVFDHLARRAVRFGISVPVPSGVPDA